MSRRRAALAARKLVHRIGIPHVPPVSVEILAAKLGIEIVERPLGRTSALLLRKEGRSICIVHQQHSSRRKRFSIAHEIGHFLLHPPREAYDLFVVARDERSSEGTYIEEIEANSFAAELLMPEEYLRNKARLHLYLAADYEEEIKELAGLFEVSYEAMTHRLTDLGLLPSL